MGRFDRLEPEKPVPEALKKALSHLNRFENLEISGAPAARPAPPPDAGSILCSGCAQPNEKEREVCWACFRVLTPKKTPAPPSAEVTLILDGQTYMSTDPKLPADIRSLMNRIEKEGYSPGLVEDWKRRRGGGKPAEEKNERLDIEILEGRRRNFIKIDGKVFSSDDASLDPDLKQLFDYMAVNGPSPALMEELRHYVKKVKLRPPTTAAPSDGDISFWNDVKKLPKKP